MDPSFAPHSCIHHPAWARASSARVHRCHRMGRSISPTGVRVTRRGASFAMDPCPHRPEGRPRRREGRIHAVASVPASHGGTWPYRSMGAPKGRDGCPRRTKGCTHPTDADSHAAPWVQASRAKDRSIQGSRTPMRSHGYGQAGIGTDPSAAFVAPMRLHECQDAGTRKAPFAGCGHPWDLMAAGKRRDGCIPRGQGVRPSDPIDPGKRREGCTPLRAASARPPHRRRDRVGGTWRSTKKASRLGLVDPCIGGKASPRSTRLATRFACVGVAMTRVAPLARRRTLRAQGRSPLYWQAGGVLPPES